MVEQRKVFDSLDGVPFWLGAVTTFILGSTILCAAYAAFYSRGLYADGAYYLFRVAQFNGFFLVDPARTTVQVLRQAPVALLSGFTDVSLITRAQVFSLTMLALPALLCALCWFVLPRARKVWVLFPLVNLLVAFDATSFEAVGEPAIAVGCFWVLFFLLLFRTRTMISQLVFLLLCWPAFHLHEGLFLLTPVLLVACGLRARFAAGWRERLFLLASAALIVWIFIYELGWVIVPRVPSDRVAILHDLGVLRFVFFGGRINLPLLTGALGLLALLLIGVVCFRQRAGAGLRAWTIAWSFVPLGLLASAAAILLEQTFAPGSQATARYLPVFVSLGLAVAGLLLVRFAVDDRQWAHPAMLAVAASLCVAQSAADIVATTHWRDYTAELAARLNSSKGLIDSRSLLITGNAERDANWHLLLVNWVIPLMSIVYARDGVVRSMIDTPAKLPFRALDARKPELFPPLRGIDFGPYRAALAAQRAGGAN